MLSGQLDQVSPEPPALQGYQCQEIASGTGYLFATSSSGESETPWLGSDAPELGHDVPEGVVIGAVKRTFPEVRSPTWRPRDRRLPTLCRKISLGTRSAQALARCPSANRKPLPWRSPSYSRAPCWRAAGAVGPR